MLRSVLTTLLLSLGVACAYAQANPTQDASPAFDIDLGEDVGSASAAASGVQSGVAIGGGAPRIASSKAPIKSVSAAKRSGPVSRVEFDRRPVRVALEIGREQMITFRGPVLFHVPKEAEGLIRVQTIGRTAFVTAVAPVDVRVIAEDIEIDRLQIPVDLVAQPETKASSDELEVFVKGQRGDKETGFAAADAPATAPPDMAALTRYAAQMLYAPRRLMPAAAGIRQVPVSTAPVPGLYRSTSVVTTPIAAWRAGNLYVTAVRFTNRSSQADIDLDGLRGHWLAATAQHNRLGASGQESDTTAVYLICDKPFEACR